MRPPASSRSEFVIVPVGLSDDTRRRVIYSGHSMRHRTGTSACQPFRGWSVSLGNHTPPAPFPEASWWPSAEGERGMSSAIRVGRDVRSRAIQRKSSRAWCTPLLRSTRVLLFGEMAFWRRPNMLRDPGKAIAMERSSPRTVCHFFMLVRFWDFGMLSRISHSRSTRCGGKWIVMPTVSTIQPRTSLIVSQLQSPFRSFFRETGSRRNGESSAVKGRKT
mmetsp:Transcript_7717/g.19158  ORF Transcript_7717/g.19158 Transcript_7717/m.19158 type:complete len:219 (-) Transcript_7717:7368-8024(-)